MLSAPHRRWRSLLWKPGLDDEIADELALHLEMRAREYAARGLSPVAAAAAARRRFGDLARVEAACRAIGRGRDRAQRRGRWLADLARDLRLAGRRLTDRPGSTLLVVLALAAGLAGAATAWRVARAVLRPLPFAEPAALLRLRQVDPRGAELAASIADYADWRRLGRGLGLAGMAAFETVEANLAAGDAAAAVPERVLAARATATLLPLLGVSPLLGRGFTVRESARGGDRRVAVLSYAFWQRRFGGDPGVVGRRLRLDGLPIAVAGVMPASFGTPAGVELWLPFNVHGPQHGATRDHHRLEVIARLRPGVSARQAAAGLAAVAAAVARFHPESRAGWGIGAAPLPEAWIGAGWTRRARLLLAAAGLLWLLASATAANLLWARSTSRQHEIDLRAALGGGRGRIVRQLYAEGLLLAMLGAAVALLLAGASTGPLRAAAAGGAAIREPAAAALGALPELDAGCACLVAVLALASSLVCTLGPALQATRPGLHEAVRQSARLTTRRERSVRDALVVAELAVATTLLATAGLLLASFVRLDRADPGFEVDHVLTLRLTLGGDRYPPGERRALLRRLEQRLGRMPGVAAAGFVSTAPLAAERPVEPFTLDAQPAVGTATGAGAATGGPGGPLLAEWRVATPGFFPALGLRRLAGRLLLPGDRDARHPVAVIDAALAGSAWNGADDPLALLGRRLRWGAGGRSLTVIGVVAGMRDLDLEAGPRPVLFLPYEELPWRSMALVVRPAGGGPAADEPAPSGAPAGDSVASAPAAGEPAPSGLAAGASSTAESPLSLADRIRREIEATSPGLPVSAVRWLPVARRQEMAAPRLGSWLMALFAAAALGLAVSGVYATAAAAVERRTQEIAVRQALGAAGGDVLRLILGRGARWLLFGLAIGTGGALLFSRLLAELLDRESGPRPGVYAGVALLLGGVAMLAALVPALRATRIAPVLALRRE
jgi:predicted permease